MRNKPSKGAVGVTRPNPISEPACIESLEPRRMLVGFPEIPELLPDAGALRIHGTRRADVITITAKADRHFSVSVNGRPIVIDAWVSPENAKARIHVFCKSGDDKVVMAFQGTAEPFRGSILVSGGAGNDTIQGGAGDDTLRGDDGLDQIFGGEGRDKIGGGGGKDKLHGEGGSDTIDGGAASDVLMGDAGKDVLLGRGGNDTLFGNADNDRVWGHRGKDLFWLGEGGLGEWKDRAELETYLNEIIVTPITGVEGIILSHFDVGGMSVIDNVILESAGELRVWESGAGGVVSNLGGTLVLNSGINSNPGNIEITSEGSLSVSSVSGVSLSLSGTATFDGPSSPTGGVLTLQPAPENGGGSLSLSGGSAGIIRIGRPGTIQVTPPMPVEPTPVEPPVIEPPDIEPPVVEPPVVDPPVIGPPEQPPADPPPVEPPPLDPAPIQPPVPDPPALDPPQAEPPVGVPGDDGSPVDTIP